MPDASSLIPACARAVAGLAPALANLEASAEEREIAARAVARGWFRPEEEERLRAWFARYLTARAALLELIDDLEPIVRAGSAVEERERLRCFLVAYAAACALVRAARFVVLEFATDRLLRRKLDEAAPAHRIPRKQYTATYRSLTSPANAWRLADALRLADARRKALEALGAEPGMEPVIAVVRESEGALRVGVRRYLGARLRYRWHSWRRRRSSAWQQAAFGLLEVGGRMVADLRLPFHADRLTAAVREEIAAILEPGDVIVSRHDGAMSNLFLPGYWPHASLHVGLPSVRQALAIEVARAQADRWVDPLRVLEARKDGVRLRALDDTLAVDACAVIRPRLERPDLARAIARALAHEGKLYNFDFDFFTDDRLVCTEVVYRAFEGVGGIEFRLVSRAGRLTLSAQDLLLHAVEGRGFEPVAVFGTPGTGVRLVTGREAHDALRASCREGPTRGV